MLKIGQLYHKDGIVYKVDSFKWLSTHTLNITLVNQANKQPLNFTCSASYFLSNYSMIATQIELI